MPWSLWWYNAMMPWRNWRFRRRWMADWVAEGRDPKKFPHIGKITMEQYSWITDRLQKLGMKD